MTGSKLKTNRSTVTKAKNIGSPIVIQNCRLDLTDGKYSLLQKFLGSTSAEDQLVILKHIVDEFKDGNDKTVALFLAVVFYEAPAKHPIKCFVARHITKCLTFHICFASALSTYIVSEIRDYRFNYNDIHFYERHVSKIMMSTENFPPGARAIEDLDVNFLVEKLFTNYFLVRNYKRTYMASASPTEKNEQFSLEHTMLRLFVHILQNVSSNESNRLQYQKSFINITNCAEILIFDEEVPMDTKSLAGILVLHIESLVTRWPVASWILSGICEYPGTRSLLDREAGRLVLLCALAAAAPLSAFKPPYYTDQPTMLVLVERILPYADGSAGSGDVTLCVARALLALASRALTECTSPASPAEPDELVTEIAESGALSAAESVDESVLTERLLGFVWAHLEHPLDAVRHLARGLMARCLQLAARGEAREKEAMKMDTSTPEKETSLEALLSSVRALGPCRSLYWAAAAACGVLGAPRVLRGLAAPPALLRAAAQPHLQAAASAAIAAVLGGGACAGLGAAAVYATWVQGALGSPAALQAVLPPAVEACPQLPAYISGAVSGRALLQCARVVPACRAPLAHRTLRAHAIQQDDESRLLVVSLLCERDRGTEVASREDLAALLWALHYNLESPRPAFRTALLHYVNKLVKRLEDSSLAAQKRGRGSQCAHYRSFMQRAWRLAAAGAGQACAPARRATALHLLATLAPHLKAGEWAAEDVDTLLAALDDSYDGNKELALAALAHCPADLLERCSPLALGGVVAGARGARVARGAAAAARLRVLLDLLPHTLPAPRPYAYARVLNSMGVEERAYYSAAEQLLAALRAAEGFNLREEAARGGAHGPLRCLRALLDWAAHRRASWGAHWGAFHLELLDSAINACARAEPAVCSQAPEGFLPPSWPGEFEEEQEQVTAQTVLVCAWRTIKEGAAVISLLAPFVVHFVCADVGRYLVALLSRARHRGAVEQGAEGLQALAHHCWETVDRTHFPRQWLDELLGVVCAGAPHATRRGAGLPAAIQALVSSEVTATGRTDCFEYCMKKLLQIATNGNQNGSSVACSDAPTTHSVSDTAVMDGDSTEDLPADVARRTLAANILRALFRHSALERASQPFVADGLKLALNGFGAAAWPERTAMSLLFCALSVRVFGVSRARGALHARNTLPAHVFAARYPGVLDAMLSKLEACGGGVWSGPAVLPVLLVLARIYPTHATPHSLQICRFVPLVQQCACASDLRVRRLAACALPALLPQDQQLPYIETLLAAVSKPNLHRNHWHGALLTLSSLIARANCSDGPIGANDPESAKDKERENTLQKCIETLKGCNTGRSVALESLCALTQAAGERACFVIAREYCGVLNLLVWKYPGMVGAAAAEKAMLYLDTIVFNGTTDFGADKELCRADCLLFHLVLLQRLGRVNEIIPLIVRALAHTTYEVYLAACDFLLIQLNKLEDAEPCLIRQHLTTIRNVSIIEALRSSEQYQTYLNTLTSIINDTKQFQECRFKSLRLLTLENDTQLRIIRDELPWDDVWIWVVYELMREINEDNQTKYMYLESLLQYIKGNMELLYCQATDVLHLVYACSSSQNTRDCRLAIISYLESDLNDVIGQTWENHPPYSMFFYKAILYSTLVTLLEDDDDDIRQRASDVTLKLACFESQHGCDVTTDYEDASLEDLYDVTSLPLLEQAVRDNGWRDVTAAASGAVLRARLRTEQDGCALLLLLALLDFRAEVCLTDARDESRVFDQSERYNVLLEESVWTTTCADIFIQMNTAEANLIQHALTIIHDMKYSDGFHSLCRDNLKVFEKLAKGELVVKDECLNPKIEVLIKKLSR